LKRSRTIQIFRNENILPDPDHEIQNENGKIMWRRLIWNSRQSFDRIL